MKSILFFILILAAPSVFAQKVSIENRDGKAVIVTRDTLESGATRETVDWAANPLDVLTAKRDESVKYLDWIDGKINRLKEERKQKNQEVNDLDKAIIDLQNGLLIDTQKAAPTPVPKETTPANSAPKAKKSKSKNR